jgi:hypothetical protein
MAQCQPQFVPDPHGVLTATVFVDGNTYGQHGKTVDTLTVRRCIQAGLDRCLPCQDHYLGALAADPLTLAYFVDYACSEIGFALTKAGEWDGSGPLPPSMTDPAADGISSPDFRLVARHWRRQQPDAQPALYAALTRDAEAVADLVTVRRTIAVDALELLVGLAVTQITVVTP